MMGWSSFPGRSSAMCSIWPTSVSARNPAPAKRCWRVRACTMCTNDMAFSEPIVADGMKVPGESALSRRVIGDRLTFCKPVHGPPGAEETWFTTILADLAHEYRLAATFEAPAWDGWLDRLLGSPHGEAPGDLVYVPGGWIPALAAMGRLTDLAQ